MTRFLKYILFKFQFKPFQLHFQNDLLFLQMQHSAYCIVLLAPKQCVSIDIMSLLHVHVYFTCSS